MKITKQKLQSIIKEEKQKIINEQSYKENTIAVDVVDEGGTLTISPDAATDIESIIAQAFGVIDDLILSIESGGYPRSSRMTVIDPRLEKMKDALEVAVDGLYDAQMQANHIIAGTGS